MRSKRLSLLVYFWNDLNSEAEVAVTTLMREVARGIVIASAARQSRHETGAQRHFKIPVVHATATGLSRRLRLLAIRYLQSAI